MLVSFIDIWLGLRAAQLGRARWSPRTPCNRQEQSAPSANEWFCQGRIRLTVCCWCFAYSRS